MNKYLGYARVSTARQAKQHSIEVQIENIEKFCKNNDYILDKIYIDKGISAYKERPEFQKMMYQLLNKDFDGVVVNDITRFGRSTIDLLSNIMGINESNKNFISIRDNFDIKTKTGKLLMGILSLISDFERETIIERVQSGKEHAKIHGTKSGLPMNRPLKNIDWVKVREYRNVKLSWSAISKIIHVTPATLIRRAKERGIYE